MAVLGPFDGLLIVPFFLEGGRFTVDDVHYVTDGDCVLPVGETEFAHDSSFGYRSSNLCDWVQERTDGAVRSEAVRSVSLELLRTRGPEAVADVLCGLSSGQPCVANAVSYRDLEVLAVGVLKAEARGARLLYRTAASFVRVRGGVAPRQLLVSGDLWRRCDPVLGETGGLVIVGSYVARTSAQLEAALARPGVIGIEARVPNLLNVAARNAEIERLVHAVEGALGAGHDTILYTSRELAMTAGAEQSLAIGEQVSLALVAVVNALRAAPAWLIGKGGITSSDLATRALGLRRARVLGQAIPGIPIWLTGAESRWPGLVYVVFPGNVGGPMALNEMMGILAESPWRTGLPT